MQLLIYTVKNSSRLNYIVDTLMGALGISAYNLTTDRNLFLQFNGAKINYSPHSFPGNELWQTPIDLLFEQNIKPQQLQCFNIGNNNAFYQSPGDFGFDIFAASFYLISRYEEYLPHQLDSYKRYAHENSLAFRNGFLNIPLINVWLQQLSRALQQKFPGLQLQPTLFSYMPTYDIDMAWSYLHKGIIRNAAGTIKSLLQGEWKAVKERWKILRRKQKDPFDIYEWLDALHDRHRLQPYYFFLLAKTAKGYDKNILPHNAAFQKLILAHSLKYRTGIHPSWQSGDNNFLLNDEINSLKKTTGKTVQYSRQHYIRMKLPDTYRNLVAAGIESDFSMGYGSINGFRASYCLPFKWYDLEKEEATGFTVYPFCFMEANSYYEQHYSLRQATDELQHYYNITRQVNGVLITIFHNHLLGNDRLFMGWKEMYEGFIKKIKPG